MQGKRLSRTKKYTWQDTHIKTILDTGHSLADDDNVFSEVGMAAHALHIHPLPIYLFPLFRTPTYAHGLSCMHAIFSSPPQTQPSNPGCLLHTRMYVYIHSHCCVLLFVFGGFVGK